MRISDWSSDVFSSDLPGCAGLILPGCAGRPGLVRKIPGCNRTIPRSRRCAASGFVPPQSVAGFTEYSAPCTQARATDSASQLSLELGRASGEEEVCKYV